jgi:hypothetical protein
MFVARSLFKGKPRAQRVAGLSFKRRHSCDGNLSVRIFLLARFLGQPESLQSRGLFTNNLCVDFVVHREIVIFPRNLLQP